MSISQEKMTREERDVEDEEKGEGSWCSCVVTLDSQCVVFVYFSSAVVSNAGVNTAV